jgi:phytoene dehydrogenase-like protein
VISSPPPDLDRPSAGDLFELLKTAKGFRRLGRANAYRLLRWLPMPVIDFAGEWFESAALGAAIAGAGVFGAFLGPRSAGSTANFLLLASRHEHPLAAGWTARGGIGAVAGALATAARDAGVEVRAGAEIRQVLVHEDTAHGVAVSSGEEILAGRVVSSADPRHTLLEMVDPMQLAPDFREAVRNIRMRGALAKVNFAVSALPPIVGLASLDERTRAAALSGWIRLAVEVDAVERAFDAAKYGRLPETPWIELAIPSLADDDLAPAGRHVVSAYVQHVPFELRGTTWDRERDRLAAIVVATIEKFAPGFSRTVIAQEVITPADLQRVHGLTGGHIFQGELALDQLFVSRPLLGWARYSTPIRNLYLCGSGTHPGTGLDGRAGALAAREILRAGPE